MSGLVWDDIIRQNCRPLSSFWHYLLEKCFFFFLILFFNVSETCFLPKLLQGQHLFIGLCFDFKLGFRRIRNILKRLKTVSLILKGSQVYKEAQ